MKCLSILAFVIAACASNQASAAPLPDPIYPFDAGHSELAWGAPYALPAAIFAGGLIRMYVVGEIEKRCWSENDNQAVLVGPLSQGSTKCYQGPGAVKYKAP